MLRTVFGGFWLLLFLISPEVLGHHSAVAFDKAETLTVTGVVTKFIWRNPHLSITLAVPGQGGTTKSWRIEGGSTNEMVKAGFDRASVSPGDEVTILLNPLKSGKPGGLMLGIQLTDGRSFGWQSESYAETKGSDTKARRQIPSLTEYIAPPPGETWQDREARTRPEPLPMLESRVGAGKIPGVLDPDNLQKPRAQPPFDLTGTWAFRGEEDEQAHYGTYEFKPHPEFTEKAQNTYAEYQSRAIAGQRYIEPTAYCYPAGLPRLMTRYGALMMLQYPTAIFMISRLNNEYRVIYLDGRTREPENLRTPSWNGESLGYWDGETLVVDTEGFIDSHHLIQQGVLTGDQLKITERISMLNNGNTLKIDFIMVDPEHWIGEWRHTKFRDRILKADVREATCLPEDNKSLPGL